MNINELIIKKEEELSETQKKFLAVHSNIISSEMIICNGIVELAKNLKTMKDEKLYVEAGFENFEDYSEKACGLKKRQAYNYIKVLEDLGENFVHSNAQIGISKMTLLSSLSQEEKETIVENCEISDISVSELKEEIAKLKSENEDKTSKLVDEENESKKLQNKVEELKKEIEKLQNMTVKKEIIQDPIQEEKIKKLKKELEELKNKSVEKEIVQDPEQQKKIESLEMQLNLKERVVKQRDNELQELRANAEISKSEELAKFKILFEDIQSKIIIMKNLLNRVPEEKQEGLKNALKKVGEMLC